MQMNSPREMSVSSKFTLKLRYSVRCLLLFILFCFPMLQTFAQEKPAIYINAPIPDSLTKGADAICRLDEHEVEIISSGKITVRERHIYTILNDNAERLATYRTDYDKFTNINDVDGTLYNAQGKEIKHFRKSDMSDFEADGTALASDSRQKVKGFIFNSYPYSVVFEEKDELSGTIYIPDWQPPRTDKMSLQISRYILTAPVSYKVRLKMINTDVKPIINQNKDKITYTWEIRNLPVVPDEPFAVSSEFYDPSMLVGPTYFEIEDYSGNLTSWDDYGKFYYSLYKGRDSLPADLKHQVHVLTDNLTDTYKKVAVLYDYLQKNTHYVLVTFGIGGLQPYEASYVARNKYGDCKALSNFMVALLKEAGIKSYPVAIWGGEEEREFVKDFPSHQSNHIICAVPIEKDTVWLECTSQFLPAGYLSWFTANRFGLLISENGGVLVHTPAYLLKDNTTIRKISAILDQDGNLQLKSETNYKALSHDFYQSIYHELSRDQQLEYLKKELNLPTYTINSLDYREDHSERLPVIHESLDISVTNYAHVTGKRIFINPDILQQSSVKLPEEKDRKLDFQFKKEFSEKDSVVINIPDGYVVESQPKDISIQNKYGRYQTHILILGDKIMYFRLLDHYSGQFPASAYEEIRGYYNSIYDADHSQIVFVKK